MEGINTFFTGINDVIYRINFNHLAPYNGSKHSFDEQLIRRSKEKGLVTVDYAPHQNKGMTTIYRDLFTHTSNYVVAHSVAKELRMARGIATFFKMKFACNEELEKQARSFDGTPSEA